MHVYECFFQLSWSFNQLRVFVGLPVLGLPQDHIFIGGARLNKLELRMAYGVLVLWYQQEVVQEYSLGAFKITAKDVDYTLLRPSRIFRKRVEM